MTTALLDRLTHHCDIVETGNDSWRFKSRDAYLHHRHHEPRLRRMAQRVRRSMPVTSANGIEIAYDDRGSQADPAILLIMGLGTQMIAWPDAFCDDLALRGFRVVRFDNRDSVYQRSLTQRRRSTWALSYDVSWPEKKSIRLMT